MFKLALSYAVAKLKAERKLGTEGTPSNSKGALTRNAVGAFQAKKHAEYWKKYVFK